MSFFVCTILYYHMLSCIQYLFLCIYCHNTSESEFCCARHCSIGEIKSGPYSLELKTQMLNKRQWMNRKGMRYKKMVDNKILCRHNHLDSRYYRKFCRYHIKQLLKYAKTNKCVLPINAKISGRSALKSYLNHIEQTSF